MNFVKKLIKKFIYGYASDSDSYIKFLKKSGADIGEDVNIFHIRKTHIDEVNPHLLKIGNHVSIVGACILTHDYSWSVIKTLTGEIIGNQKKVIIGNNVFIGYGTIVLGGTVINDNVIIGANSLVCGELESNYVYAGNPVKKICSIDDYILKRKKMQLKEASEVVKNYKKMHGCNPPMEVLHEYFYLFIGAESEDLKNFRHKLQLCDNFEVSMDYLRKNKPMFSNYEEFIKYCSDKE